MTVTSADIAITLGRPTPADGSADDLQWSLWIGDVIRLIQDRLGDPSLLDQDTLDYVVREVVAEKVRRGDGATSQTVSVDDGSVTRRWESGASTQLVDILESWWDLLTPNSDDHAAFTIRPYAVRPRCL